MTHLTKDLIGAMLILGGVEPSEKTESGSHPDSMWHFSCPESVPAHDPLWREGGEYKTRKGNIRARKLTFGSSSGSNLPPSAGPWNALPLAPSTPTERATA